MSIPIPAEQLDAAARAIEAGELVVVPTSRWYMLCCDAGNVDACARVYHAKRRALSKPLLLVLSSKRDARKHFRTGRDAENLIDALWPGDVALLLRWLNAEVGQKYSAVGSPVALVGDPGGVLGELARRASLFLAATSANVSGTPTSSGAGPAITTSEVVAFVRDTGTKLAAIIDGGICPQFTHMTIVDCSDPDSTARIVREGTVHRRAVAAALGREAQEL